MAGIGGRPKGSTNLQNKAIKDMIRAALDKKGGSAYFERVAEENQTAFCTLIGKLIPAEINVDGELRHKYESLVIKAIDEK